MLVSLFGAIGEEVATVHNLTAHDCLQTKPILCHDLSSLCKAGLFDLSRHLLLVSFHHVNIIAQLANDASLFFKCVQKTTQNSVSFSTHFVVFLQH